jgi:hypothetical protein
VTLNEKYLPMSTTQIVEVVVRSPEELQVNSIGYAIMARDVELLCNECGDFIIDCLDICTLHLFRPAGSYLGRGKFGRNMLAFLANHIAPTGPSPVKKLYISESGSTVLDSLLLSFLEDHTSYTPAVE